MIIPVPKDVADKIIAKYPFYVRTKIAKDTYAKQSADVDTVTVKAMLVASTGLNAVMVYNITRALFTNLERMGQAHAQGKNITLAGAVEGLPIPVHEGANKFYREQ